MTPEHRIQNEIRNALAGRCILFRANVGTGWTGKKSDKESVDGKVVLYGARPFSTGLPPGFSDLFGITPDGRYLAIEVKAPNGKTSLTQSDYIAAILKSGGRAGVAYCVADALAILELA
jgi:hypothetical protein